MPSPDRLRRSATACLVPGGSSLRSAAVAAARSSASTPAAFTASTSNSIGRSRAALHTAKLLQSGARLPRPLGLRHTISDSLFHALNSVLKVGSNSQDRQGRHGEEDEQHWYNKKDGDGSNHICPVCSDEWVMTAFVIDYPVYGQWGFITIMAGWTEKTAGHQFARHQLPLLKNPHFAPVFDLHKNFEGHTFGVRLCAGQPTNREGIHPPNHTTRSTN